MEEELMVLEDTPLQEVKVEIDSKKETILPEVSQTLQYSGRGRKPKRKRGRPAYKNKVNVTSINQEESSAVEENDDKLILDHSIENFSIKLEKVDSYGMVGKVEKKQLLDVMSEQFNSADILEPPKLTSAKRGKRGRGKWSKKECPEQFLEPAGLDEGSSSLPRKKEMDEDFPESPNIEEDNQGGDNELEYSDLFKSRGGKRSRPHSLETSILNRTRNRVGSQSPATGKESPISESSNDSSNSRSRGRLRQAIAEEMNSLNDSKQLTPISGGKRGRGRVSVIKSEQTHEVKGITQNVEIGQTIKNSIGRPRKIENEVGCSIPIPQNIALKTFKKKKKHFKGLRYSFGVKKKKPKPKINQSLSGLDSFQDNESLISEEIDAESFDSSSIETSSAPMSTGLDPYDPTEEFDDSQVEKKELSFHQQRLQNKDLEEQLPEEDNEDGDEEQSWNAYAEDDETYPEDCNVEDQEEAYVEQQYEQNTEDLAEEYQEVNNFIINQDDYAEDNDDQEEAMEEEEDRQYEEEDVQYEEDVNQEYGDLLQEEYEEEDIPIDYDVEGNEEAIANGIEYMDDTHEGIERAITYESEQAERELEYNNQLSHSPEEYEETQVVYEEEEQMEFVEGEQEVHEDNFETNSDQQSIHDEEASAHDDPASMLDSEASIHDDPASMHDSEASIHDDQVSIHDDQVSIHDSEASNHDDQLSMHDSEASVHDDQLSMHDSEASIHDDQLSMHDSEASIHEDQRSINDDQQSIPDNQQEIVETDSETKENLVKLSEEVSQELNDGDNHVENDNDQLIEKIPENMYEISTLDEDNDSTKLQQGNLEIVQNSCKKLYKGVPPKQTKIVIKPKKIRKVKAKKFKKPHWTALQIEHCTPLIGQKRKHDSDIKPIKCKKKKLLDDEIASYVQKDDDMLMDQQDSIAIPEQPSMDDVGQTEDNEGRKDLEPSGSFEDHSSDSSQQTGEKFVVGEPGMNILVEEDSTDTSEASMNLKGEKNDSALRRVSKRRNGDSVPGIVDDKGESRKSKRLNTMSSSGVLTIAARSDGKSYPKLVEEIDQDVANPTLKNALCKCRVNLNPKAVNVTGEVYCQGFDCFDGRMIGCCNIVANNTYLRVSPKIPFMLLCAIHRHRLRRHNCCPGCGLFCTQGVFSECRWNQDGTRHYYHKLCGLIVNGVSLCPHCGTAKPPLEVHLELKLSRKPVIYLKQHQEKKGLLSSARMTCPTLKAVSDTAMEDKDVPPDVNHVALPNGIYITAVNIPTGVRKDRLNDAINSINCGKVFNMKASPKAIYWACKYDDLEKLLWVLVSGLSPNAKVREYGNQTGLHTAAMYGSIASAHVLVLAGACFDLTDTQLLTPLMVAISKGHNDLVNYLVQAGANLHARTDDGMTCLHLAAKAGNYESCKHILDSGRLSRHTINVQDEGGWTPLVWASENRCINVVKLLLDRGADPQICDVEQNTALHWAAFSGSTHICSMVLERGCSLKSMNGIGDTPLHIAARQNHVEVVAQLLARGSNLEVPNKRNQSPLDCCLPDSESFLHITLNKKLLDVMRDNGIRTERILCSDIACGKESVPITCVNGVDEEDLPKNYVYISENCEALNVNIDRTISSLKWCECRDGCNTENCVCSQLNFQCWYDPEGKLLVDFNYADPPMIFECNRACGCNKLSCHNRVVQHGITAHTQLFKTEGKGWGVRALKDISKGSYVCEYVGEIITDLEADQREDDSYLFDLDNRDTETYCIDARQYANIARFINHLCEPNLTPVKVFIDHQDLVFPRIAFFANRDIEADEELGFDYGEKFWVIKYKQFTCSCGGVNCKYSSETIHATLEAYNKKVQQHQQEQDIADA